ncbi:MAG: BamA/TamA family outer membrane protein [Gemmatimonadaceae bacterium]|jgi:hypothetical protein|nr:BamA/TamA family outer membrane protein [Gemmatimonadaceae bacterium]
MSFRRTPVVRCVIALSVVAAPMVAQPPAAPDSTRPKATASAPRRRAVTPELERTAFADEAARALLARARVARLAQDAALESYDAKSYQRINVSMGVRRTGFERLMFRGDNVARVQWQRGRSLRIEPLGQRMIVPFGDADTDGSGAEFAAIPYFPGRESLWFPSSEFGLAKAEVDDRQFVHPLATGAESYYRFATGDSVSIRLPNGTAIGLRELRITARRPDWKLFVGSFWFDTSSAQLVRASYRMSNKLDVWPLVTQAVGETRDSLKQAIAEAIDDETRKRLEAELKEEDDAPGWVKSLTRPLEATFDAITVEYALYNGKFWLPKANSAEGSATAMFMKIPIRVDERFTYLSVDGDLRLPELPPIDTSRTRSGVSLNINVGSGTDRPEIDGVGDSARTRFYLTQEEIDKRFATADSLARAAEAKGDTARARRLRERAVARRAQRQIIRDQCTRDSTFEAPGSRFNGALRYVTKSPCDSRKLSQSKELPPAFDPGDILFDEGARDALLASLDMQLQPGWGPTRPTLGWGFDLMRYNRVEALSVGAEIKSDLGLGYRARALGRIGVGDGVPNGELSVERTNGRRVLQGAVFHRLRAANEEFGSPLSFGASLPALLYGRDEGFYFRSWGAEVSSTRTFGQSAVGGGSGQWGWRFFGERQRSVGDPLEARNTWSLARVFRDSARFLPNIDAQQIDLVGLELNGSRTYGVNPNGWRATTGLRLEGATGTVEYGRALLDLGASRPIGPTRVSLTGMAGSSVGDVPVQRNFYMGGARTVRGQVANTQNGNAFWLTRTEISTRARVVRPVFFFDIGWAGDRENFLKPATIGRLGRPQRGVGLGWSTLDGLFRMDLSRGIAPQRLWRLDLYLDARL